jgi:3'(2'), 5'-bisphosphate nucleotidase
MPTTIHSPDSDLLDAVVRIARRAGHEILEVYGTDFASHAKADQSPVTAADLRAHQLICAELDALTPLLPVLSEESAAIPFSTRQSWSQYWLVDPLDGTREFIARNGEFTVNIALISEHSPVLGVVHVPVSDTTYSGIVGLGAWREANERARLPIHVRRVLRPPLRVVGSRSHGNSAMETALARLGPHELKPAGSSIKLCLVAEGAADLYPRLGPTSEWDIAAGQAIVEAAGGQVVRISDGLSLQYNTGTGLLNPDFMAYGDASCFRNWPRS